MTYESWRISYQSSESAARAAWKEMIRVHHRANELEAQLSAIGAGGVEPLRKRAAAPQAVQAAVPVGWKLIAVNPEFDNLMYWLDRCHEKGHLEQCSDLIEPWLVFDYDSKTNFAAPAHPAEEVPAQAAVPVVRGEVLVTVSGFTGSGKSAIAGEIEIMCRALGLQVEWPDGVTEKNMTHADWTTALELYNPRVRIIERNVPRNTASGADQ